MMLHYQAIFVGRLLLPDEPKKPMCLPQSNAATRLSVIGRFSMIKVLRDTVQQIVFCVFQANGLSFVPLDAIGAEYIG